MRRLLSQVPDHLAIHFAARCMARPDGRDLRVEQAQQLLQSPAYFPSDTAAPHLEFLEDNRYQFASPLPGPYAVNNIVTGRFYRCADAWREKPCVLFLHGWNDVLNHRFYFPAHCRRLIKMGFNAATLELPMHFSRRPRELGSWGNFLSADLGQTVVALRQALADIRAFINWLRAEQCPFIGLWGISLGGLLTGLTVCNDSRIDAAALVTPVARLERLIQEIPFCATIRQSIAGKNIDLRKLNLTSNRPAIGREKILLVEAEYDVFVPKETVEELWDAWSKPELWRLKCGHITVLRSPRLPGQIMQWLAAKALVPAAK